MKNSLRAKSITAALFMLATQSVLAAETWTGSAYLANGGALTYHEIHYLLSDERLVVYTCPDGKPFARKTIHEGSDAQAPDFSMLDARSGYREGVRGKGASREIFVQRAPDQAEKSAPLDLPADGVVDAGFDTYVRRHWDALARGDTLRFKFLVPSKRTFYAFDLARVHGASNAAQLTVRLSLGAWYSFLAPSIDVTYDRHTRRLLRFAGMSNIRDENLKNLNVRIEFPQAPVAATAEQVATARAELLTQSCAGSGK
ncbi:MAG TPA: hypothetical protein VIC31_09455 [Rudaea sp.]|jgi:hypothetical protein